MTEPGTPLMQQYHAIKARYPHALLDVRENNFLAAVAPHPSGSPIGLAFVDLSTGEFQATEFCGPRADEALRDELQLLRPRETLLPRPQQLFETAKTSLLEGAG